MPVARLLITLIALPLWPAAIATAADSPTFSRDIRTILSQACFACHGPDAEERKADLRLDVRDIAVQSGAVTPGKPLKSELIRRINSKDPDIQMPPPESGFSLSEQHRATLGQWIQSGASYEQHWSFIPPRRPDLPQLPLNRRDWPSNGIDYFVLARLERDNLSPARRADSYTLIRRLYLDLIGLPPASDVADRWADRIDKDPLAYQQLVDQLLAAPQYGEHWARRWLDLARYADTNGYEKDRPRSIWPFRDWVIRALNVDMPYDQFSVEQLAGDMLPNASARQRIATGFHRNTMLNEEGGIDPLEYRFYATVDRVATTGTVWLGLTVGCAQCHTHKYDPISHSEYYRLMALLNNADEPDLAVPTPELLSERQKIDWKIETLEHRLLLQFPPADGPGDIEQRRLSNLEARFTAWLKTGRASATAWTILRPSRLISNLPKLELLPDGSIFSSGDVTKRDLFRLRFDLDPSTEMPAEITALRLEVMPDDRLPAGGPGRAYYEGRKGDFFLSELSASLDDQPLAFNNASHSYGKIAVGSGNANATNIYDGNGSTGWSTAERPGEPHQLVLNLETPIQAEGQLDISLLFERHFVASLGRFRLSVSGDKSAPQANDLPVNITALLTRPQADLSEDELKKLLRHFTLGCDELAEARKPIDQLRATLPQLPITLVMQERPADNPRPTYRHNRGEYLSPREEVTASIPDALTDKDNQQLPTSRLELAHWLVSDRNPLVARVTVNRAWQAIMGIGLVASSDDFGSQGELPSHPQLLDWLATEFVREGWSFKRLHRLIVTSATYQQSSHIPAELLERDPDNRLLARGPRFRVDAELVRDIMLTTSGLYSSRMLGPSVRPPQPAGATLLAYGNTSWPASTGADRYRRSLYTFSKRTAPFAAYLTFDGPSGENCITRRNRSNTPLQALTLLNDEMFMEMALALAQNEMRQQADSETERITRIFRRLLTRPPSQQELAALADFHQAQLQRLRQGEIDPARLAGDNATAELAAWVMVARVLINLDEVITRQ